MLAGITVLSAAAILLYHFVHPEQSRDAVQYIKIIGIWHQSGIDGVIAVWPNYWVPPLLFYLSQLFMGLGLSPEAAGLLVTMSCGSALPLVVFLLSKEVTQRTDISLGAAFLTAINPVLIELSGKVQREIPYLFFAALAAFLFIAAFRRKKWFLHLLAGSAAGIAFLIRYEAVEWVPIVFLYLLLALFFKTERKLCVLRNTALFFAGFCCALSLLLAIVDSPERKMAGIYQQYFKEKFAGFRELYVPPEPKAGNGADRDGSTGETKP